MISKTISFPLVLWHGVQSFLLVSQFLASLGLENAINEYVNCSVTFLRPISRNPQRFVVSLLYYQSSEVSLNPLVKEKKRGRERREGML